MRLWTIAAMLVVASTGSALAQDLAAGEKSFAKCRACHDIGPNAKNKVGPELNGLDGRKAGTLEGYNFTPANRDSGITWTAESFDNYIRNPSAAIPKTRMAFLGISNANERKDLWAYLAQFDATGNIKK